MGNMSTRHALDKVVHRAEDRVGRINVESRYHRGHNINDDYDVKHTVLGTGVSGSVVLAINRCTKARVAVKTLNLRGLTSEKKRDLLGEVEIFLCLDHPHVARLFDVYEWDDSMHLVMECMEGGELFDRVGEKQTFVESDAAEATWQMILAVNYLHSEGMAHRDLKLENWLYESKGGHYLKLIDFGFSKILQTNSSLDTSCGTILYVAPEVLAHKYTTQCDLWSLGVIVFILLSGYMPFHGKSEKETLNIIKTGHYVMKSCRWSKVSKEARDFVKSLLVVDPNVRLTAEQALEHPWLKHRHELAANGSMVDDSIAESLTNFAKQTRFRRACMQLMAWSLSRSERAEVRGAFMELDLHHTGVIKLTELKSVLVNRFHIPEHTWRGVLAAFEDMDHECDGEIRYSDFLAAMMSSRLKLHDNLLREAFRHFDTQNQGFITPSDLKQVLGKSTDVQLVFDTVDIDRNGQISVEELVHHLREGSNQDFETCEVAHDIIDTELRKTRFSNGNRPAARGIYGVSSSLIRSRSSLIGGCFSTKAHSAEIAPSSKQSFAKRVFRRRSLSCDRNTTPIQRAIPTQEMSRKGGA